MNKSRRSRIDEIIQKIEDLCCDIDVLRDEEEESYGADANDDLDDLSDLAVDQVLFLQRSCT